MYTKEQIELASTVIDEPAIVKLIAVSCHQQNKAYCESIGDHSQPPWASAPEWQRESAIAGVMQAITDPNPAAQHESWLEQKKADGWVYGEVKDAEKKTHPCMVAYGDLPEEQKKKDALYIEMVQQLSLAAGLIRIKE